MKPVIKIPKIEGGILSYPHAPRADINRKMAVACLLLKAIAAKTVDGLLDQVTIANA